MKSFILGGPELFPYGHSRGGHICENSSTATMRLFGVIHRWQEDLGNEDGDFLIAICLLLIRRLAGAC